MEYRPFPDERVDEFRAFMRYAFSPADGPYDPDEEDGHETIADRYGLFDDDEDPVAVCAHHDFSLRIRDADRAVAGLSAVASPPEHRRRGNIARMLGESLGEYRERGVDFAALWPFEYPFYARYGWATASRFALVTAPPDQLGFVDDLIATAGDSAGTFRRLGAADYPAVTPVLRAMADRYDLTMDWTEEWWRERVLKGWKTDPFVYGWERDGELRAICAYTFGDADDGDGDAMRVSDALVADDEAWFQLLRFFRNHDSQVDEVRIRAPPDAPLLDLVEDPRAVDCEVRTGPMIRLVDAPAALTALGALGLDTSVEATVSLAIEDPLADWNDGLFRVAVADDDVTVDRIGGDGGDADSADPADPVDTIDHADPADPVDHTDPADPDARVDIGTLSQLAVGYRTVDEAVRSGGLSIDTTEHPDLTSCLDALFPPRSTHLREGF